MQDNPMCLNIRNTLLAEPPAIRIAKDRRKFPAGILVPDMSGWLFQVCCFLLQLLFIICYYNPIYPSCNPQCGYRRRQSCYLCPVCRQSCYLCRQSSYLYHHRHQCCHGYMMSLMYLIINTFVFFINSHWLKLKQFISDLSIPCWKNWSLCFSLINWLWSCLLIDSSFLQLSHAVGIVCIQISLEEAYVSVPTGIYKRLQKHIGCYLSFQNRC